MISVAPDPYAVAAVIEWLMGALTDRAEGETFAAWVERADEVVLLPLYPQFSTTTTGSSAATLCTCRTCPRLF